MNKDDYEKYESYKKYKNELWERNINNYHKDVLELERSYDSYLETIKDIEYIVKNKKSVGLLIQETFAMILLEFISWIPFIMSRNGSEHLGKIIPIMFIIFSNTMLLFLLINFKENIKCNIKYNKLIK